MANLAVGESYGIPDNVFGQPSGGLLGGLGQNTLFNIGLGILANNTGNYGNTASAIGRGVRQGINNVNQSKEDFVKQQIVTMQMKKMLQDQEDEKKKQEFLRNLDPSQFDNPQAAEAVASGALSYSDYLRQLYANKNGVDPYYTPIPTEQGIGRFNNRTGEFGLLSAPDGKPFVKSSDSPELQGRIKGAESAAAGDYKINTSLDGVVTTDTNLANQINGGLPTNSFNLPYPVTLDKTGIGGAPGTTATDRAEGINSENDINVGNPAKPRSSFKLGGIKVPTAADKAAAAQTAKDEAEYNSPEAAQKRKKNAEFKKNTANNVIGAIDGVLNRVDGWSAGVGGSIMQSLPLNSEAKDVAADIETIKANFGFDRLQTMRDMSPTGGALGQVAVQELSALQASVANLDPSKQSPEQLKRNLTKAKNHYQKWLNTLEGEQGGTKPAASQAMPMPAKPNALTLKKGVRYSTPKGDLTWNGKAFED